ncbi:hypothetical protein [Maribellus sp. YY47]|uniref:hypothetical protein n=1 Tax=Maribellus sp. YY47 TaxID=2929486 RepID=UPI002000AC3A|nr:hypothetical protein [Maribellus sp. YY47]MCK3683191.1 hypothetical protein [Maribellus sp. YY47]
MLTRSPRTKLLNFLILILLISSTPLNGQTNFRPGYYITWDNDTVYGLIDYRGEIRNSRICEFRENENAEIIKLEADKIQSYRFIDDKFYVSKTLQLPNEGSKPVFVEFLVSGIINLYFYRDVNNYMYLVEKDGRIHELTKNVKDNNGIIISKHIGLLKAIFSDCNEIQSEINKVGLNHKSLIDITNKYHDCVCSDTACIIYEKSAPKAKLRVAPVISGGIGQLHFDKGLFSNYEFDKSYFPTAGMLFSISLPYWNQKLSFDIETDFSKLKNHGTYTKVSSFQTEYYNADINFWAFQPSISLKYTFSKNDIKPTLSAGLCMNYIFSTSEEVFKRTVSDTPETIYELEGTPLASNIFGIVIQAGCDYKMFNNKTLFTNLRVYRTVFKEAGVSTLLNTVSLGVGMYLTNN